MVPVQQGQILLVAWEALGCRAVGFLGVGVQELESVAGTKALRVWIQRIWGLSVTG